jgi:hypothetical protein
MSVCSLVLLSSISRRSLSRFFSEELNRTRSPISFDVQEVVNWLLMINACRPLRSVCGDDKRMSDKAKDGERRKDERRDKSRKVRYFNTEKSRNRKLEGCHLECTLYMEAFLVHQLL